MNRGNSNCSIFAVDIGSANSYTAIPVRGTVKGQRIVHGLPRVVQNGSMPNYASIHSIILGKMMKKKFGDGAMENDKQNVITDFARVNPSKWNLYATRDQRDKNTYRLNLPSGSNNIVSVKQTEALAGMIDHLRAMAQRELGRQFPQGAAKDQQQALKGVVLTVPSFAPNWYRNMLLQACQIAGGFDDPNAVHLLNQSSAAAIAYGNHFGPNAEGILLIFAMGAATTECSIFKFTRSSVGKTFEFELLASEGRTDFGGDDFTAAMVDWMFQKMVRTFSCHDEKEWRRKLWKVMEDGKEQLTDSEEHTIQLASVDPAFAGKTFTLTRGKFSEICAAHIMELAELVGKLFYVIQQTDVLTMAGRQISRVLRVGGASNMPIVEETLCHFAPGAEFVSTETIVPILACVKGAAFKAAEIEMANEHSDSGHFSRPSQDFLYSGISLEVSFVKIVNYRRPGDRLPTKFQLPHFPEKSYTESPINIFLGDNSFNTPFASTVLKSNQQLELSADGNGVISIDAGGQKIREKDVKGFLNKLELENAKREFERYKKKMEKIQEQERTERRLRLEREQQQKKEEENNRKLEEEEEQRRREPKKQKMEGKLEMECKQNAEQQRAEVNDTSCAISIISNTMAAAELTASSSPDTHNRNEELMDQSGGNLLSSEQVVQQKIFMYDEMEKISTYLKKRVEGDIVNNIFKYFLVIHQHLSEQLDNQQMPDKRTKELLWKMVTEADRLECLKRVILFICETCQFLLTSHSCTNSDKEFATKRRDDFLRKLMDARFTQPKEELIRYYKEEYIPPLLEYFHTNYVLSVNEYEELKEEIAELVFPDRIKKEIENRLGLGMAGPGRD